MKRLFHHILISVLLALLPTAASAQKWAVELNALSLVDFGTISPEVSMSVAAHFSLHAGGKFNFWTFHSGDGEYIIQDQHKIAYIGVRYWPWYVYSGWWLSVKAEYLDYRTTGIWRPAVETGRGFGLGLGFGYTKMLNEHFNLDFGLGGIGGWLFDYRLNNSQTITSIREEGARPFLYPDMILLGIMYVF